MCRAVAVLVVLGILGCGGSDDDGGGSDPATEIDPAAEIKDAVETTLATGTARQTLSVRIPHIVNVTMSGTVDFDADAMRARATLRRFPHEAAGRQLSVISANGIDYYRSAGSRRWIQTKTSDALSNALDVPTSLGDLGGLTHDVRSESGAYIDGKPTTRYVATVELKRLLNALTPDQAELFGEERVEGGNEVPLDISIDPDGLIRRVSYDITSLPAIVGAPGPLPDTTITLVLDHFGEPERLAPRPPDRAVPQRGLA